MDVNLLSAISSTSQNTGTANTIAGDFDAFLSLLTTQLRNQNPLDPLDTNQFTEQLVQFTSVEQSLKTNDNLSKLLALTSANAVSSTVGYIGKNVTANGATTVLENGSAQWSFQVNEAAPDSTISVRDQFGNTVFSQTVAIEAGSHTFIWDGKKTDGTTVPDGSYTISIDAKNAEKNAVSVTTSVTGTVSAIDMTGSEPVLTVGGSKVKLSDIKTVSSAL